MENSTKGVPPPPSPPPFMENNFDFSRIFSQNFLLL